MVDPVYYLRVFSAKGELGARQCDFEDSPAFKVVPSSDNYAHAFRHTKGIIMELSETLESFCGRQIQPQVDLSIIKEWLEFCHNNHKTLCKEKSTMQIPPGFRVIDCLERKIVSWDNVPHPKQYMTLSYVWESSKDESAVRNGIIPNPAPGTIEDTIILTINLGYRYLWIDRYCIPLDDAANKQIQIKSMGEIYQHSMVTVVATAGSDCPYGLPGIGATTRETQPCVKIGDRTLVYTPYVRTEILNSKWNSRGWTYQEGLLSRRKLVFTATQVYFQCSAMHCLESIRAPLTGLHVYKNVRMRDNVEISRVFPLRGLGKSVDDLEGRLTEYLQRSLTFESDILDAFRGVLAAFERMFPLELKSLCGIPIFHTMDIESDLDALVHGLSWWSTNFYKEGQEPRRRLGFPSWTWAGWKLPKISSRGGYFRGQKVIVDVSVEYADGCVLLWNGNQDSILAREKSGSSPLFFRICGPTLDVQISPDCSICGENEDGIVELFATQLDTRIFRERAIGLTRDAYRMNEADNGFFQFTLLMLSQSDHDAIILLLYQPEGSLHFERIDGFYLSKTSLDSTVKLTLPDTFKGWRTQEVVIG
ncbi:hypothetical protein PV08_06030 [Exophiala spinifera]|uniref:Heterokaryon incompatibility domain-containing protein n=1 Tax=Exophiala spinifera TaxID=91928 RepID=A0A0D2BBL6_9EURO|nr:uncharacterized protein PV08_06030 [Exophiala spinifera]KIW15980.1 hypothetical protein PV08_06030 [Exophiala spinifera]